MFLVLQEQKVELLRICGSDDVECLQYHLKAAYGYSGGSRPSYAHLGCDPKKDPACKMLQKAPAGLYMNAYSASSTVRLIRHTNFLQQLSALLYFNFTLSLQAPQAAPGSCNPLFEDGCNPLTATRFSTSPESYKSNERDQAAAIRAAPPAEQYDPYSMYRDSYSNVNRVTDPYAMYRQASAPTSPPATDLFAVLRQYMAQAHTNDPYAPRMGAASESNSNDPYSTMRDAAGAMHLHTPPSPRQQHPYSYPSYEEPAQEERHPLGPPGKTKEGYDCFIGYDRECYPVKPSAPRSGVQRRIPYPAEAYEPHLNSDGTRNGVLEPVNPHCDPEYDRDCRLRRYETEQPQSQPERHAAEDHSQTAAEREQVNQDQYEAEPYQSGQEESHTPYQPLSQGMPSLQDILRRYGDQYPGQEDHRAYADNYHKK